MANTTYAEVLGGEDTRDSIEFDETLLVDSDCHPSNEAAWADLSMQMPNDVPPDRICAFVECVLVELTHEPLGAVLRENAGWGTIETITIAADRTTVETEDDFLRCRRDPRIGTSLWTCSWATVRENLIHQLRRNGPGNAPAAADSFGVHPLSTVLRWD